MAQDTIMDISAKTIRPITTPAAISRMNCMATPDEDLGGKLVRLADGVLDELLDANAGEGEKSLDQRLDALKIIGTLHLGMLKQNGKKEPDDDAGGLPEMRARLKAVAGDK